VERYIVEILGRDPNSEVIIVPIYERIVDGPDPALEGTVDQALFIYATGDHTPLERLLEICTDACEFVANLREDWFVRAETASDQSSEAKSRSVCSAVALAHAIRARTAARAALEEC
jgi:hypothetical protein